MAVCYASDYIGDAMARTTSGTRVFTAKTCPAAKLEDRPVPGCFVGCGIPGS